MSGNKIEGTEKQGLSAPAKRGFFASPGGIAVIVGGVFAAFAMVGVVGFLVTGGGGSGPGPRTGGASALETEVTRYLRRNDLDAIIRFDRITTGFLGGGITMHGVRLMAESETMVSFDRIRIPHWRMTDGVLERFRIEIDGYEGAFGPLVDRVDAVGHPLVAFGIPADAFTAIAIETSASNVYLEWRFNSRDQTAMLELFSRQAGLGETRFTINLGRVEAAALRDLGRVIDDAATSVGRLRRQDLSSADTDRLVGNLMFVSSFQQWLERNGRRIEVTGWRRDHRDLGEIAAVEEALAYIRLQPRGQVSLAQAVMDARRSENPRVREHFEIQERGLGREYMAVFEASLAPQGRLITQTDFRRGGYPLFDGDELRYFNNERLLRDRELVYSNR